jgi:hypothetical protein
MKSCETRTVGGAEDVDLHAADGAGFAGFHVG